FFQNVFNAIKLAEPKIPSLSDKYKEKCPTLGSDHSSKPLFTENFLKQFVQLTPHEVESLKKSHSTFLKNTPNSIPKNLKYRGSGIVYAGGGKFNWLALLSIKSLRRLGSKLPVEILIPTLDDYEIELCTQIFPAYNARCIYLPEVLGQKVTKSFQFKGYQYKILAILASSFEKILLLDADNIPVINPDYLFKTDPFISNGLVTWPDFWRRTTSPYFYDVAQIKLGKRVRYGYTTYGIHDPGIGAKDEQDLAEVPLHDREGSIPDSSTESGQLMVNKKTHFKMLLLSLYYNSYGPDYFYPLLSQGSMGEGDKDTFLAAAVKTGSKFYQVNKFVGVLGYDNDGTFQGTSMIQSDPVEDYREANKALKLKLQETNSKEEIVLKPAELKILFVHSNYPKLNPALLKKNKSLLDKNDKRHRHYGKNDIEGYDLELKIWEDMKYFICKLKVQTKAFEGMGTDELCKELDEQIEFLKST
ncbi:alpha-mannosyltransferase, partial [Ascoidea rubescens DSM 1968]